MKGSTAFFGVMVIFLASTPYVFPTQAFNLQLQAGAGSTPPGGYGGYGSYHSYGSYPQHPGYYQHPGYGYQQYPSSGYGYPQHTPGTTYGQHYMSHDQLKTHIKDQYRMAYPYATDAHAEAHWDSVKHY